MGPRHLALLKLRPFDLIVLDLMLKGVANRKSAFAITFHNLDEKRGKLRSRERARFSVESRDTPRRRHFTLEGGFQIEMAQNHNFSGFFRIC